MSGHSGKVGIMAADSGMLQRFSDVLHKVGILAAVAVLVLATFHIGTLLWFVFVRNIPYMETGPIWHSGLLPLDHGVEIGLGILVICKIGSYIINGSPSKKQDHPVA
jgi:hypothetical protein